MSLEAYLKSRVCQQVMKVKLPYFCISFSVLMTACEKREDLGGKPAAEENKSSRPRMTSRPDRASIDSVIRGGSGNLSESDYIGLSRKVSALDDASLREMLDSIGKGRNTPEFRTVFILAATELAKRSPEEAAALFVPEEMQPWEAGFIEVSKVIAGKDPKVLEAWLSANLPRAEISVQGTSLYAALGALGEIDPQAAVEMYFRLPVKKEIANDAIGAIFRAFGKNSPAEAEAVAAQKFSGRQLDVARTSIALGCWENDPQQALRVAAGISEVSHRGIALGQVVGAMATADPKGAVAALDQLSPQDLQAALRDGPSEPDSALMKLAQSDPVSLSRLLDKLVVSRASAPIFEAMVKALSGKDPEQTANLLDSIQDGPVKERLITVQYSALGKIDSAKALAQVAALPEATRGQAYDSIAKVVGAQGLQSVLAAASTLPEGQRASFIATAMPEAALENPREAATYLLDKATPIEAKARPDLVTKVANKLASSDLQYANEWMKQLPEAEQPDAMEGIAAKMVDNDIHGLSEMLGSMPKDRIWERGTRILIRSLRQSDPEMARQWRDLMISSGYK